MGEEKRGGDGNQHPAVVLWQLGLGLQAAGWNESARTLVSEAWWAACQAGFTAAEGNIFVFFILFIQLPQQDTWLL